MKKFFFAIMFLLLLGIAAMSCRTSKTPCPAYPVAQQSEQPAPGIDIAK